MGFEGVNERVARWLLHVLGEGGEKEQAIRGWVLMDFYDEPEGTLIPFLVECNYRGR